MHWHTYLQPVASRPGPTRVGSDQGFARCATCGGTLRLSDPARLRVPGNLLGHDEDCYAMKLYEAAAAKAPPAEGSSTPPPSEGETDTEGAGSEESGDGGGIDVEIDVDIDVEVGL